MTLQQRSKPGEGLTRPAILARLARIQASPRFANAPRLCQLLAYLVEHSAEGDLRDLQEFAIGVEVFGRGDGFDPQSDTIVRVTVGRLRRRLAEYYRSEGREDRIRFRIPVGHYRVAISIAEPPAKPGLRAWARRHRNRLVLPVAACAMLAVVLVVEYGWQSVAAGNPGARPDPDAMQHLLLGQQLLHRRGPGDLQHAAAEFEHAVAIDASIVDAWIGLAWALRVRAEEDPDESQRSLPRQYQALEHALTLDPTNPEANARMAALHAYAGDPEGARRFMKRALKYGGDNNLVLSTIAGQERASGNLQRAIELQREATRHPPLDAVSYGNLGYMLYEAGDLDEALDAFYTMEEISPGWSEVKAQIVKALILEGELQKAEQVTKQLPPGTARQQALTLLHWAAGRKEASDRALQALAGQPGSLDVHIRLAEAFAFRGEHGKAMDEIETAYEQVLITDESSSQQCNDIQGLLHSPYFATLSLQPRFQSWANQAEAFVASARPGLVTLAALERDASL